MAGGLGEQVRELVGSRLSCQRSKERPHTGFGGRGKEQVLALAAHILGSGRRSEMGSDCRVLRRGVTCFDSWFEFNNRLQWGHVWK